jgi:hypothetical protein
MHARPRALLLLGALIGCAGGSDTARDSAGEIGPADSEGSGTATSGSTQAATTDEPGNCVPGQQIECACPGGAPGAQACLPDGSGYDACECPSADGGESSTGEPAPTTETSSTTGGSTGGSTDDCNVCGTAALMGACAMSLDACLADPACATMVGCTQQCGITQACADGCVMGMMDDAALAAFQALVACVVEVCPSCGGMP